jgi:hypothetical protein
MLICTKCKKVLMEVPIYNNAQDDMFPPTLLFCSNPKCERHGLFTAAFLNDEKTDKKSSDKGVQS